MQHYTTIHFPKALDMCHYCNYLLKKVYHYAYHTLSNTITHIQYVGKKSMWNYISKWIGAWTGRRVMSTLYSITISRKTVITIVFQNIDQCHFVTSFASWLRMIILREPSSSLTIPSHSSILIKEPVMPLSTPLIHLTWKLKEFEVSSLFEQYHYCQILPKH